MSLVRCYSSFSLLLPVKIKLTVHYPVSKASKNSVKQATSSQLPPCPASVSSISWINEAKQRIKNATRVLLANQQTWLDYAQPEDSAASKGFPLNKQTNKQSTVFFELSVNLPTNMSFIVMYHVVSNHILKNIRAFILSLTIVLLLTNKDQILAFRS